MLKRTKLSLAVGAALSAGLIGFAPVRLHRRRRRPSQQLDRVEVTGSLIKRIEGETSLPVVTLNVCELEKAGVTNAEQAVKFITQQQGGTVTSGSVSGTNGAASYADLRSLGSKRTLVLLNGKRVVSNPFSSQAVDLNTLPTSSLERIEVLPDGASATYGTDAIAGVINFITRKEYKGLTVGGEVTNSGRRRRRDLPRQRPRRLWRPGHAGLERLRWLQLPQAAAARRYRTRLHAVFVDPVARLQRPEPDDVAGQLQPERHRR